MKKRIFAIILAALMVVPFGMLSVSADTASIPDEPTYTGTTKVYVAHDKNEAGTNIGMTTADANGTQPGDTPDYAYKTSSASNIEALFKDGSLKDGGKIVIVGKFLLNPAATEPYNNKLTLAATTQPVVITAKDGDTNYTSMKDGDILVMNADGNNAGQFGMFMLGETKTIVFEGDVIFDNVVILSRQSKSSVEGGKEASTIEVNKSLVVTNTVKFAEMTGEKNYNLVVNEGAYAYIHALGFEKYTGKGTLVVDETLKDEIAPLLADFEGTVEYVKVDTKTEDTTSDETTTAGETTTAPTDNPTTGDMTVVVAALAAFSVAACISVVIVKKTKEN